MTVTGGRAQTVFSLLAESDIRWLQRSENVQRALE